MGVRLPLSRLPEEKRCAGGGAAFCGEVSGARQGRTPAGRSFWFSCHAGSHTQPLPAVRTDDGKWDAAAGQAILEAAGDTVTLRPGTEGGS
jgi:hypothetical protein